MLPLRLMADPTRVVVRPFHLAWQAVEGTRSRTHRIVDVIMAMTEEDVGALLEDMLREFESRHWQMQKVFHSRCDQIGDLLHFDPAILSQERRLLIGAHFCQEYSFASAALTNPSVVPHPDQSGLSPGHVRIILSLRAVGEGHTSVIAFREGIVSANGSLHLAPFPPFSVGADVRELDGRAQPCPITVYRHSDSTLSGTVLYPVTAAQINGLEDLRLLRFTHDDGSVEWIGTYTAYSRHQVRSELLRTQDFRSFDLCPIIGTAALTKGLALFPRRVNGRYAMIGRHDGENLYLLQSDSLTDWNEGRLLLEPRYPWEVLQIGNCGAPIELAEGWLLLTHGVGAMRKYAIGAVLLDKDDPSRVLARSPEPILAASDEDREGYVPNVVYTCGAMIVGDSLFMPFGIADSSVAFIFMPIADLLSAMVPC